MKRVMVMFLMVCLPFSIFAQSKTLVRLSADINLAAKLNLPVFYRDQQNFIVAADQQQLRLLKDNGTKVTILSENLNLSDLYMVSRKDRKQPDLQAVKGSVLFNSGEVAIIKAAPADLEILWKNGLQALPLQGRQLVLNREQLYHNPGSARVVNPLIQSLVSEVNADSVQSYIQKLQDMQTRFCFAPNRRNVATWIKNKFIEIGVTNAVLDSFFIPAVNYMGTPIPEGWHYNVVATITGTDTPQEVIVVGGHHDSITGNTPATAGQDPFASAPGADDNGSAVANCLENARVMIKKGYHPKSTVKFMTYDAEEIGLIGSQVYADLANQNNENIKLMINTDMIATNLSPVWKVQINPYTGYEYVAAQNKELAETYTNLTVSYGSANSQGSDSYSFYQNGYPVTYFEEFDFSPYYHSYNDILSNCNIPYCAEVIKGSVAMLVHNLEAPGKVKGLTLTDLGNGTQLKAVWRKNSESDITGYKISVGTASGSYTQNYTTADTSFTISGLTAETLYFVGISAVDADQIESLVLEVSGTPRVIPVAPVSVTAASQWQKIKISWQPNQEADIAGYNLYRSIDSTNFAKINAALIGTTFFEDSYSATNSYRYYKVSAVDQSSNEGPQSSISAGAKPITLDKGIIVIDETLNGSGTATSPNDLQQDQFFSTLTTNCPLISHYDAQANNRISLSELGPYSTVIWHNQSVELGSVFSTYSSEIKQYLDFGGKLLITADKPGKLVMSNNSYPSGFGATALINQYLGIDSVDYKNAARFSGALPAASGYVYLPVDTTKTSSTNGFQLKKIETLHAKSADEVIYKYDSKYEAGTNYGSSKGKPVGVIHNGANYQTATLAVPLYYIKQNEARQVVEYILREKFGETVGISDDDILAEKAFTLYQNYPNPFNPATVISYNLLNANSVRLAVYNCKGEMVKVLVNGSQSAGKHSVSFDATGLNSGVYFYKLEADGKAIINKAVLIK